MIEELRSVPLMAMHLDVAFDRLQDVGDVTTGRRRIFPVNGGHFEGSRLRGTVLADGADWVLLRKDGAMVIDVRLVLKTDDAALIAMQYTGLMFGRTPEAQAAMRRGERVAYESVYIRTTPRFETTSPSYDWLNRVIAVANGQLGAKGGVYHVFEIK